MAESRGGPLGFGFLSLDGSDLQEAESRLVRARGKLAEASELLAEVEREVPAAREALRRARVEADEAEASLIRQNVVPQVQGALDRADRVREHLRGLRRNVIAAVEMLSDLRE